MEIKEYEITVKVKLYAGHKDSVSNIAKELTGEVLASLSDKQNVIFDPMELVHTDITEVEK